MSYYSESATFASPEYRVLNPDIEPTVRFKLRKDEQYALPGAFALLRIAPEPTFHLGAGTIQITQFVNLPRFNHPTLIRLAVVTFRVDPVEISVIFDIYLLMDREDMIFNAFYGFFSVIHLFFQFCIEPLAGLGDGGRGNAQEDGLFGYGELQVRKDVGADVTFCESRVC